MFIEILLIISAFFGVYLFINSLINFCLVNKINTYKFIKNEPFVSILVPARNEENNIEKCILSLLSQKYNNFEIIVLNDNSTDNTGTILHNIQKTDKRLKVISGKPLPKGWLGKNWACHQLSLVAKGKYILFVDADTIHNVNMVITVVSAAETDKLDFLSMMPKYPLGTWFEKVILPFVPLFFIGLNPFYIAQKYNLDYVSLAIGQFLFFKRDAYDQIGGYSRIRSEFLDDVSFARIASNLNLKWKFFNGSKLVSCRLYHNFREVFLGFTKNAYGFFNFHLYIFLVIVILLLSIFFAPFFGVIGYFVFDLDFLIFISSILIIVLTIYIYSFILYKQGINFYYSFYYPFTILSWLSIVIFSYYKTNFVFKKMLGRAVYDAQKTVNKNR